MTFCLGAWRLSGVDAQEETPEEKQKRKKKEKARKKKLAAANKVSERGLLVHLFWPISASLLASLPTLVKEAYERRSLRLLTRLALAPDKEAKRDALIGQKRCTDRPKEMQE